LALVLPLAGCGSKTALGGVDEADAAVDSAVDSTVDSAVDSAVDTAIDAPPDTRPPCVSDEECDDGIFCNGREFCNMGGCGEGLPVDCAPPPDGCTMGFCDESIRDCIFTPIDADMDMHFPEMCGGDDCDDDDPTVFRGAPEICDYQDNDCNGGVDERLPYVGFGTSREVSVGINEAIRPDIVYDGDDYDIVYDTDGGFGQVAHASVNRNGRGGSSPSEVTFSMVLASSPDLTWTGSDYGLWHHFHLDEAFQGTVSLTRLRMNGSVRTRAVAATLDVPDADVPAAAWNGSEWGVAYVTGSSTGRFEIRYLQASAAGVVSLGPVTLASSFEIPFIKPSAAWTGTRFVIAWGDGTSVFLEGRNRGGTATAWQRRLPSGDQPKASIVWASDELMLTWTSSTRVDAVHLARYTDGGMPRGSAVDITPDRAQQTGVDAVWTGRELGVTYQRGRTAAPGTYVIRVAEHADWISPPGLVDDREMSRIGSAIAATGREYGVAFPTEAPTAGAVFFRRAGCEE